MSKKEKKRKEKKGNLLTLHQSLLSAATGQMPKAYLRQCIPEQIIVSAKAQKCGM